jgi:hypothetical protein
MKGISQDERRGFNKYKLNHNYISYNDKTRFYKKTKETSAGRYEEPLNESAASPSCLRAK